MINLANSQGGGFQSSQKMNILSLDTQYRYLYFNDAHAESMLHTYGRKLELGVCIFDMITLEKDITEVKGYYDRALAGEAHISHRVTGSGSDRTFYETFYNPVYNEDQVIIGVSVFAQDITERQLAEDHIRESDSMRELLLDIITHDLRNPIGIIFGLSEMLSAELPENNIAENIFKSCKRLVKVLQDTTLLSQATFGESIPRELLNLRHMLADIVMDFKSALAATNIDLDYDGVSDIEIQANPLIGEVFKNYISNAIKYAAEGKRISIESVQEQDAIIVKVKDFGRTIAKEDREAIFARSAQLSNGKNRGRGLGLAIVKRIAEAHGGSVWVEANIPRGNCFILRLPTKA